ncbi:hypothetical protein SADUNF_Sadunf04G0039400 [Salix dunnii]|uniref:Palmitoyltransferase n=1 Tax=Salix dunnii TaxID=1413687 RepID=A0A835K5W4_9ROSI|nr:hypothetical protein SADUNF_Sadunf04G0039400 [Salix dunnii]
MEWKRFLSIPVFSVFLLMGFVYFITVFIFIEDWARLQSSSGTLNAVILTFMASLCLFSFVVCVLTEPGYVPSPYVPDVEGAVVPLHQEPHNNDDSTLGNSYFGFNSVNLFDFCIDHHCLWINNLIKERRDGQSSRGQVIVKQMATSLLKPIVLGIVCFL